jgi:predicted kinase
MGRTGARAREANAPIEPKGVPGDMTIPPLCAADRSSPCVEPAARSSCPRLYVVFGNVSAGKTTLARRLARHLSASHLSSDQLRVELHGLGRRRSSSSRGVFELMAARAESSLAVGGRVILDSTGMAPKFGELVAALRARYPTLAIRLRCDERAWRERERRRTDRWIFGKGRDPHAFAMPARAFRDSSRPTSIVADITIDTSGLDADAVYALACARIVQHERSPVGSR